MGLLIDSTACIHAERRRESPAQFVAAILETWGDVELGISVMSAGELFHGCWRADTAARRARLGGPTTAHIGPPHRGNGAVAE